MTDQLEKRILFADDKEEYRASIRRAVLRGYAIDEVSNADDEIAYARKAHDERRPYALIITDNQMEDGYGDSGIYAIRTIREFDKMTPIILHTASHGFETVVEALAAGAHEVIPKPANIKDLREKIEHYVRGEQK